MRKEVVATFIFYHGDGSGISCSRFRLYGSGETGRNKAEKARKENNSILAKKYEKEAKKWSESGTNRIACMDHGNLSIQRSRNDKRTDRSSTGCSPEKRTGKS